MAESLKEAVAAEQRGSSQKVPLDLDGADEDDEDVKTVYVKTGDGLVKRVVKTGKKSGDKTEILSVVREGDEILLETPKED